jgi:hypothetical protein
MTRKQNDIQSINLFCMFAFSPSASPIILFSSFNYFLLYRLHWHHFVATILLFLNNHWLMHTLVE